MIYTTEDIEELLYRAAGKNDFEIYLAKTIDNLEDKKYSKLDPDESIKVNAAYDMAIAIRNKYYELKK